MTLFQQIGILISTFIILVIGSVMYLNFKSTNDFIQNQLYTTAEDTATSLGLSLSMEIPKDGSEDYSTMQTMVNAIFDRGYYEKIMLTDMDGKVLIKNSHDFKVKTVPQWFIKQVNLNVPVASSQISAGWMPFGKVHVKIHSGHAYIQLWSTFTDIIESFIILSALTLLGLYIVLKLILFSLTKVENQALAITKNDFIIQKELPFTKELKSVVTAMNSMVKKVKEIFEHEALVVQKYNDILYNDQDTGMGNRKFFSLRLSSLLEEQNAKSSGTIIIFVLNNFAEAKQSVGYQVLAQYINKLAELFYEITNSVEERVVTRLKDSEFSIILPQVDYDLAKKIAEDFLQKAQNLQPDILKDMEDFYILAGATYYDENDKQKDILARADFALSNAQMRDETNIYFHELINDDSLVELGKEQWHKLISHALSHDGIKLALQPVKDENNAIYHKEVYLRMSDEKGNMYPARVFVPMLNALHMSDDVDKKVIELSLSLAKQNPHEAIAINVMPSFIKSANNLNWLENLLKSLQSLHVSFEASNYAIVHNLKNFVNFSKLVQKYNYSFGIDNFSISEQSLNYLQDLKPAYIKANRSFFIDMHEGSSSYESLKILTNSLDIKLIATAVESEDESKNLKEIPINLMQGEFVEKPSL